MKRARIRDLGISTGRLPTGKWNAITDVAGVRVGQTSLVHDVPSVVRTGVTAIWPAGDDIWTDNVYAGSHSFNGNGEMTGLLWIADQGLIGAPICITNTYSVGLVRDAICALAVRDNAPQAFHLPVAAETYDGWLSDSARFPVTTELALAAMDVGTAFGGIGASREMTFAVFAEPALMLVFVTLSLLIGTTNLDLIATALHDGGAGLRVSLGLTLIGTIIVAIAENGRIPVDNPATHLELTMVHEAMVLEYSAWHLALIEAGAALKLLIWLGLIASVYAPFGLAAATAPLLWPVGLLAWAAKIGLLATALAVFEVSIAKMRVFRVPEYLGVSVLLGLLAAVFLLVSQGFA